MKPPICSQCGHCVNVLTRQCVHCERYATVTAELGPGMVIEMAPVPRGFDLERIWSKCYLHRL